MAKKLPPSSALGQNFLKSPKLVSLLVRTSSLSAWDTVYEVGPGRGIITAELVRVAQRVIVVERAPLLVQELRGRFRTAPNLSIVQADFLRYRILDRTYKVFANIPYNITSDIVRKILYMPPSPDEAYLIMQKEAAQKFAGTPRETQFSILAKPLYDFQILRQLRRTDFDPVPGVDSVLLHVKKHQPALLNGQQIGLYQAFVRYGFGRWRRNLRLALKSLFTYKQWKRMSKDLCFSMDATPSELSFEQWLGLFQCYQHLVLKR